LATSSGNDDLRAGRQEWLDTLAHQADVYLRTPAFLHGLKAHVDMLSHDKSAVAAAHSLDTLAAGWNNFERVARLQREQFEQLARRLGNEDVALPPSGDGWEQFLQALRIPSAPPRSRMGVTPHKVVHQEGTLRLLWYGNRSVRFAEPILICYALVNRPYILDLQGDRSVVRRLLDSGFEVFLIDWGVPRPEDHGLQLRDYVCRLLKNASEVACRQAGTEQLSLLGYCMGGTMSAMFAALYPQRVRNLILLATPIDFAGQDGLLNLWSREQYFDVDRLIDSCGNCPGEFLRYCFQLLKPVQNFAEKYVKLCENLSDNAFLENFFALERWASDSIPVAGETFREYVKLLYQQNRLVKGEMSLDGKPVNLEAIRCPLLLLVALQDHLVPPPSTLAAARYVGSREVHSLSIDAGHIGLAVSSRAHRQLWPQAAKWIDERSTRMD
jgi:polyhydroxyalkanoate synthase